MTRFLPAAAALLLAAFAASPGDAAPAAGETTCVLETRLGKMAFRLFPQQAPRTVENFRRLVEEGFYDGKPFYRVVAGHVIQAGDGGENDRPTVPAEFNEHPHVVGALGLARDADPDSGSTEIYVCLAPRPHLDGRYTVFGQLIEGFDVLAAIGAVEVEERFEGEVAFHRPLEPVLIDRAYLAWTSHQSPTARPDLPDPAGLPSVGHPRRIPDTPAVPSVGEPRIFRQLQPLATDIGEKSRLASLEPAAAE